MPVNVPLSLPLPENVLLSLPLPERVPLSISLPESVSFSLLSMMTPLMLFPRDCCSSLLIPVLYLYTLSDGDHLRHQSDSSNQLYQCLVLKGMNNSSLLPMQYSDGAAYATLHGKPYRSIDTAWYWRIWYSSGSGECGEDWVGLECKSAIQ